MAGITRTRKKIWDNAWVKNADGTPREFVFIKKFSFGDRERIEASAYALAPVNVAKEVTPDNLEMTVNPRGTRFAKLKYGIASWCILEEREGENGETITGEIALTDANIEALNPDYAEYILSELEALNPERKSG